MTAGSGERPRIHPTAFIAPTASVMGDVTLGPDASAEITSAAMSAEHLFNARAVLLVPPDVRTAALRRVLEGLANELMVDLTLDEAPRG